MSTHFKIVGLQPALCTEGQVVSKIMIDNTVINNIFWFGGKKGLSITIASLSVLFIPTYMHEYHRCVNVFMNGHWQGLETAKYLKIRQYSR